MTPSARTAMARWGSRLSQRDLRDCWFWLLLVFVVVPVLTSSQLTWTPIYVGNESQIDLWTQKQTGCPCSFNSSKTDCACCVPSGGCSCGAAMPNRCTQCGLEKYCANMCNVTLDSRQLFDKSDRSFGQIKSPQLEGPSICTYRFVPDTGQRVELQVWRMISIGRHNGTACEGGWLQFEGGARICGRDSRLQQPIVLFSDKPQPVLHMQINEHTERSQVYAFYSFASQASVSVGWPGRGGRQVNNTECDWIYEESSCSKDCILASPGYPGLYPPNSRCRYFIMANSTVSITLTFTAVLMPLNHCTSDYIDVYAGLTTSSALLKTLCEKKRATVVHVGKDMLVEFRSGPEVAPFEYNGFVATLTFVELTTETPTTTTTTTTSTTTTTRAPETMINSPSIASASNAIVASGPQQAHQQRNAHSQQRGRDHSSGCDVEVSGEKQRIGSHSTRGRAGSAAQFSSCRLLLLGRNYDTVHVSIANYNLRGGGGTCRNGTAFCKSQIEVFDGLLDEKSSTNAKPIAKICGPISESQTQKQNSPHDYVEKNRYSSNSRNMTIVLTRASDEDYMDVSYYFHNDRESGTQQPKTLCDVEYYGLSSPSTGTVVDPKTNTISRNAQCKQHFIPAANQAVIITLNSTMNQTHENSQCTTQCGDQGCRCASDKSLDNIDHLLLVSRTHGNTLACLCGNNRDWLPVEFWSTTPVYIEWSRSSHVGLNLTAEYKFVEDSFCGSHDAERLEGEIQAGYSAKFSFALNHYYQQKCTYIIDSPPNRDLVIQIESSQTRPCTAWNITVQEYNKTTSIADGPRLHTFCPRDIARNFTIAQEIRSVMVKLQALGRTAPQYVLRWRNVPANSTRNTRDRHSITSSINVAMASASGRSIVASPVSCLLLLFLALLTT